MEGEERTSERRRYIEEAEEDQVTETKKGQKCTTHVMIVRKLIGNLLLRFVSIIWY